MSGKLNPKAQAHIKGAQLALVETALITFVEDLLGRVPTDDEIQEKGWHINVEGNALAAYVKDGKALMQFFIWDLEHVVALGFVDKDNPLALSICRIAEYEWPFVVAMQIRQARAKKDGT